MKRALLGLALASLVAVSGCYTMTVRTPVEAAPATVEYDERWHHGALLGIVEISGPYDLSAACPQGGWAEITTETSFLNGLLELLTSGIYASQTVSVRCAAGPAGPAPSAPAPATPPAPPSTQPAAATRPS
jgi:hypothetical protein